MEKTNLILDYVVIPGQEASYCLLPAYVNEKSKLRPVPGEMPVIKGYSSPRDLLGDYVSGKLPVNRTNSLVTLSELMGLIVDIEKQDSLLQARVASLKDFESFKMAYEASLNGTPQTTQPLSGGTAPQGDFPVPVRKVVSFGKARRNKPKA